MNQTIELNQVFVPGGYPQYTYQKRTKIDSSGKPIDIEVEFLDTLKRLQKFVAVAGPTKSGKTVLVQKLVGEENGLWIEGGHIDSIEEIWAAILDDLGVPTSNTKSRTKQDEHSELFEVGGGFKPGGIGAEAKANESSKRSTGEGVTENHIPFGPKAATEALLAHQKILVIDDFHYMPEKVQTKFIQALKPAVFRGLKVVLLLIPHRMHEAARREMDVQGRTATIVIPDWKDSELFSIADEGFKVLNVKCDAGSIDTLVKEAFSSPHLMQDFCSKLCHINHIDRKLPGVKRITLKPPIEPFFRDFANSVSPEAFNALKKGPDRTNRKPRDMVDGGVCDTYEAIFLALHLSAGETPINWITLKKSLQLVLAEVPQQHEVTRVLEKMDEIAKDFKGEPIIDYMKERGELHLVDPFFRFYVKWSETLEEAKIRH